MYAIITFILLGSFIIFGVIGVYKTENGIVLGLPDYEKRDIHVSQVDLNILTKADALLSSESTWRKGGASDCAQSEKLDLYCALEKASIEVMGKYVHSAHSGDSDHLFWLYSITRSSQRDELMVSL